jgi:type II secretory pathway component PulM
MSYLARLADSYLLIAGAILLLAILFIEYRLSRIAFKLDKTNAYLARADQLLAQLAEQTGHLEALALNAASRSAIAAQTAPAARSAHAAGRESARDPGSPGPTEF